MSSPKLNILQIITSRRLYGAERILTYLCEGLRQRGHDVSVACKPHPELEDELARLGIPTYPLAIGGKVNPLAPFMLASLARRLQADVIHTHLSTASLWGSVGGRLAGVPVVAEVHALNTRRCFMLANRIVTCSEGVRQHLLHQQVPPQRMEVLHNGLPDRLFRGLKDRAAVRAELGIGPQTPVIGAVAHLAEKKGQRHLLEAMLLLRVHFPEAVCLFIGEGETHLELAELAEQLGVDRSVRFLGFRPDAVQLMVGLDVVVLPSVAKEGLGVALIEAGFLGKPVVGSDCPGIDEVIVSGETGLLAPPGDSMALADAIGRILRNPVLAKRFGENGRRRAQRLFSMESMAENAEQIYYSLLSRRRMAQLEATRGSRILKAS